MNFERKETHQRSGTKDLNRITKFKRIQPFCHKHVNRKENYTSKHYMTSIKKEDPVRVMRSDTHKTKHNPSHGSSKIVKNKQFLLMGLLTNKCLQWTSGYIT